MIGFDELTHFTKHQFFYMLSRNRTDSGVAPYVRATCNPDADSWVADFIKWWIEPGTGYPIPERSGVIRYMIRVNDEIIWGDSVEELAQQGYDPADVKSVTFIASTLQDNKILMEIDPGYLANLKALPTVERERLLFGNWKIKAAAGLYFRRTQVGAMLEELPKDVILWCRGWDLAATSEDEDGDPAYTAGVLIGKRKNGRYVVADVINKRLSASDVRKLIKITAQADRAKYGRVIQRLPQDPGQAGKEQAQSYTKMLAGFLVKTMCSKGKLYIDNFQKYGHTTWYEWRIANWDTKWNACDSKLQNDNTITFETAWSAPEKVIRKLAKMYPDLMIEHWWADEDIGNNTGHTVYKNGSMAYGGYYENESEDAYETYILCWGESNCIYRDDPSEFDGGEKPGGRGNILGSNRKPEAYGGN